MPIRLSALTADRRTVKVSFGDDTLTLTYKPSSFNAVQEARELEEKAGGRHILAIAKTITETVASWDLQDDDGKPLPITEEVCAGLGLDVLLKLSRAITEDLLPNPTTPTASRNGSTAAGSAAAHPTGTTTS